MVPVEQPQSRSVERDVNVLRFARLDSINCVNDFMTCVYLGTRAGYIEFALDMSKVQMCFPNTCAPLAGLLAYYRTQRLEFEITGTLPPYLQKTAFMDPLRPTAENLNLGCLNRVWQFSADEVNPLVTAMVRELARSIHCEKGVMQAFEWALNEVMDNVIQHSGQANGFVMGQLHRNANHMAVCVFDYGQGIFNSLRNSVHAPGNPVDAISLAIKEGVTRDPVIGQGNGLWGLYQIVRHNKGALTIVSNGASWTLRENNVSTYDRNKFPSKNNAATTVDFQIKTAEPLSLSEALRGNKSRGSAQMSVYVEQFETTSEFLRYNLSEQTSGTGTRRSGERIRTEVINLIANEKRPVIVDFTGLSIVSSSFADELVGKLLIYFGFADFNRLVLLRGMNEEVRALIDRSVAQRMVEAASKLQE